MASCQQTAYHAACPHAQHTADSANVCRGLVGAIAKVFGMNGSRSALRSCKCCLLPPLSACSCHHLKYAMFSAYLAAHHLNKSSTLQLCRTAHHPRHLRTPQRWNSLLSSLLVVSQAQLPSSALHLFLLHPILSALRACAHFCMSACLHASKHSLAAMLLAATFLPACTLASPTATLLPFASLPACTWAQLGSNARLLHL